MRLADLWYWSDLCLFPRLGTIEVKMNKLKSPASGLAKRGTPVFAKGVSRLVLTERCM
jgi:hypothetical protein